MDLGEIPYDNEQERDFQYKFHECHYAIFSCPPSVEVPTGSLAFITFLPEHEGTCGVLRVFNPEKGQMKHGFQNSLSLLRRKFHHMKGLVERNQNAKLVWEGNMVVAELINHGKIFTDQYDRSKYFNFN